MNFHYANLMKKYEKESKKGKSRGSGKQLFGFRNTDLKQFDQENIEKLLNKNLIEKKLIKPIYLS